MRSASGVPAQVLCASAAAATASAPTSRPTLDSATVSVPSTGVTIIEGSPDVAPLSRVEIAQIAVAERIGRALAPRDPGPR